MNLIKSSPLFVKNLFSMIAEKLKKLNQMFPDVMALHIVGTILTRIGKWH